MGCKLVSGIRSFVLDTHAGGREIHLYPICQRPQFTHLYEGRGIPDPIARAINPRRFLSQDDLNTLREIFPSAVGARVFISGFIIVLFNSRRDIETSWEKGLASEFGLLRLGYDIVDSLPMSQQVMKLLPMSQQHLGFHVARRLQMGQMN
jgi:hypothetical protein